MPGGLQDRAGGNNYLKTTLVEAALSASRTKGTFLAAKYHITANTCVDVREQQSRFRHRILSPVVPPMRFNRNMVQSEYDTILERVRNVSILHVDETSIKVQGMKYWIWVFTTPSETFIVIRKSGTR